MEKACSYEIINSSDFTSQQICDIVYNTCNFNYFNLLTLNFCFWNDTRWFTLLLALIILLLCFYLLSSTGNDYLIPAWAIMCEKINLSQHLAGLTLFSWGNQVPDVMVAILTGGDYYEGVNSSLASVLGGGIIVIGLVLSSVIFLGKGVNIIAGNYIRDLLMYWLSVCIIIIYGHWKKINLLQGICFISLYIIYAVICIKMDSSKQNEIEGCEDDWFIGEESINTTEIKDVPGKWYQDSAIASQHDDLEISSDYSKDIKDDWKRVSNLDITSKSKSSFNWEKIVRKSIYYRNLRQNKTGFILRDSYIINEWQMYSTFRYDLIRSYWSKSDIKWDEMSIRYKILFVLIDCPFNIIRDLTIPAFELHRWKRGMFISLPITLPLFFIIIFNLYDFVRNNRIYLVVFLASMALVSFIFFRMSSRASLPKCEWVLLISGFVISIVWIWAITNIVVDMIHVVRLIIPIEVPQSYWNMTILAFGNSWPDFLLNWSLAKSGFSELALSSSIGAPVFGLWFGFGIAVIKRIIITDEEWEFDWMNLDIPSNRILIIAICTIFIMVCERILFGIFLVFKLPKVASLGGYIIYMGYFWWISYFIFFYE